MKKFFPRYHYIILISILAFAFISRIWRLNIPEKYIFDEVYHVPTAKLIALNDPRAFEWWHSPPEPHTAIDWLHPPLAKYTQAFFIKTLGANSFAWRLSSALFGVGVIFLIYKLSYLLFKNYNLSLLASFLASLDGLLLAQSRIAMNDIHVTFFILLTLIFYLKFLLAHQRAGKSKNNLKLLVLTGLAAGLAMGSKWSGVFVLIPIYIFEFFNLIKSQIKKFNSRNLIRKLFVNLLLLTLLPITIYISSYAQMFFQGHNLKHLYDLHKQIWWYQTHLKATHNYQSRPYQWFLNLKPVWFDVTYIDQDHFANIYSQGNSVLFWAGDVAIIVSILFLIYKLVKREKINSKLVFLILSYFSVWILWQFSPRIMFFYHYTPAVPLLSIILSYWLMKLFKINKYYFYIIILLIITNFVIFYPHWTGLKVSKDFANKVYFALKPWK